MPSSLGEVAGMLASLLFPKEKRFAELAVLQNSASARWTEPAAFPCLVPLHLPCSGVGLSETPPAL